VAKALEEDKRMVDKAIGELGTREAGISLS
jgi:hypothetical protein